ncbi:hypothetical protein C8R45DRAFT_968704 [Mycena sanguinolenta]|nr:hypothetical protein C8R45DRAFT_968704 [Mycena sanguinolenta]
MSLHLAALPDEVLSLIFYQIQDPTALTQVNRRLLLFSQDPYVRASYFIARHPKTEALSAAFTRGKLLTPRVIDILVASGAHVSRYLVQVACHHFFYCQSHFLKPSTPWVRNCSLDAFTHFIKICGDKFDKIPRGKHEDDGALFATFIKEAKFPAESKSVSWETIRDIFQKYLFIPFSLRDPLMSQLPLALAIEPRLLPYAVANGFEMDAKYRDFVFRKMFEKTSAPAATHVEEIVANVRELCRLDADMFVTRTVAAEVCLEAKTNEAAYKALKQLDRAGDLPFCLPDLVQDVIKLFLKARGITNPDTAQILTQLYTDFLAPPPLPASVSAFRTPPAPVDPTVRRTMFLSVFAAEPTIAVAAMPARLAPLRLGPLSLKDAADILLSAFIEKHTSVFDYLRREGVANEANECGLSSAATRKATHADLRGLAEDVAVRCLTRESKGKMLKRLCEAYPTVRGKIVQAVLEEHRLNIEDLALLGEAVERGERVSMRLAREMGGCVIGEYESDSEGEGENEDEDEESEDEDEDVDMESDLDEESSEWGGIVKAASVPAPELGGIGLETLSTMIRRDELGTRTRRRYWHSTPYMAHDPSSRLPKDPHSVAKWIKTEFGATSSITATFFTHAIINRNHSVMATYTDALVPVPITLKHFQALAQLGSGSDYPLYDRIKSGAPFYKTEHDYLAEADAALFLLKKLKGKAKATGMDGNEDAPQPASSPLVKKEFVEPVVGSPSSHKRKRPRRSAAVAVNSYVVPDSDDEAIAAEEDKNDEFAEYRLGSLSGNKKSKSEDKPKEQRPETDFELWVKALAELHKEEQRKYREKKKRLEKENAAENGGKIRVPKSEFFRSLTSNLRLLRDLDTQRRMHRIVAGEEVVESDEDEEYVQRKAPKAKRRKTIA